MSLLKEYCLLLSLVLCAQITNAQLNPIFQLDDLEILPANPTPNDSIFITLTGVKLDSCAELDTLLFENSLLQVGLRMDWSINEDLGIHCAPATIPFDTTINIGTLPPGFYQISILSDFILNLVNPADLNFEVAVVNCSDEFGNIWVTSRNDSGPGSLREAITCANDFSGPNTIKFFITNANPPTISVGNTEGIPLPILTDPNTTIDGRTQPGWNNNGNNEPIIIISGTALSGTSNGLEIRANNCEVFGVQVSNFSGNGIHIQNASSVIIGGSGSGNILTNNSNAGISLGTSAFSCQINGNWIGTDDSEALGIGNGNAGILAQNGGTNSSVGLGTFEAENIIIGNATGAIIDNTAGIRLSKNRFECNDDDGIVLVNNGNGNISAPEITLASPTEISGTVPFSAAVIEVYINAYEGCPTAACQGSIYLGTTFSNINGWTLTPPFANGITLQGGERITATQALGSNQSSFASCKVVAGVSACTDAAGNISVTNTQDTGVGSLREAINCANSTNGANTILFNIPGSGPFTINVGTDNGDPLPPITSDGTIVDGQGIILDGGIASWPVPADGLTIAADLCEIYNLTIINFADDGISLENANANKIGGSGTGNIIYGNGVDRDFWPGVGGGPYNGSGIHLNNSTRNEIFANFIGTNPAETITDGNEFCGILIEGNSQANTIGQEEFNKSNTIFYNEAGIQISTGANENEISSNRLKCNSVTGIHLGTGANNGIQAPEIEISRIDSISGFSSTMEGKVELFLFDNLGCTTSPCQGKTLLASQDITDGNWLFTPPFNNNYIPTQGDIVVLTITDINGNTSAYSDCSTLLVPCFVELQISALVNTTCNLDNGSVEVMAENGTPNYLYNIGNGNTPNNLFDELSAGFYFVTATDFFGCTAEAQVQIGASTSPEPLLISSGSSTCEDANGMLEFAATSGVSPYLYSLDGGSQQSDGLFSNLSAGTYTVEISDAIGCTNTLNAQVSNNGISPIANFTFATNFDTVQFTDASIESSTIFYDFGNGMASSDPNPQHVYGENGTFNVCQIVSNSCGIDTLCQPVTVMLAPTLFSIEGAIFREDLAAINNVELTCVNSDISDNNGDYFIDNIPTGSNCQLTPSKTDIARLGVSITDIIMVQRHLVFLDTLDSPYKIIAADVNGSESVNITDLISMQRVILFIDTDFAIGKTWRFIPESFSFPNPLNPFASTFPEEIGVNGLSQNEIDQNFIGLKVGDVNNSASPINVQSDDPLFLVGSTNIDNNRLTLNISAEELETLSGLQGGINFDPTLLKPINSTSRLDNLTDRFNDNSVNFVWWESSNT